MRELFVWYRVDDHNADTLRAAVEAMQRSLEQRFTGLQARLLIRREADRQTWMETFARAPRTSGDAGGGVDSAIEAALAAAALALRPLLASDRHAEAFEIVRSAEGR